MLSDRLYSLMLTICLLLSVSCVSADDAGASALETQGGVATEASAADATDDAAEDADDAAAEEHDADDAKSASEDTDNAAADAEKKAAAERERQKQALELLTKPVPGNGDDELKEMRKEGLKLQTEIQLAKARLEHELRELQEEHARLQAEYQLQIQRQKNELLKLEMEKQRLAAEAALTDAQINDDFSEQKVEMAKWKRDQAYAKAKLEAELSEAKLRLERAKAEQELASAQRQLELEETKAQTEILNAQNAKLQAQMLEQKLQSELVKGKYAAEMAELETTQALRNAKLAEKRIVANDVQYPANPFEDGVLQISDRRVPLNGAITMRTADYICDRIDFFNNRDPEAPIFIVIDSSPGGSVMAGYRILKSMEGSSAPVHVIVKSYAASMAAAITTLADHSYAYPNAIILHHQMSSGMFGNLTQQRERLEEMQEWSRRLAGPIAKKMGMTEEEMVKEMYKNDSTGDWAEFADKAIELKWVGNLVHTVKETGIVDQPSGRSAGALIFLEEEKRDPQGNRYIELPRLQPFDAYFMYDPDNYYRWR